MTLKANLIYPSTSIKTIPLEAISLKSDNQGSIALVHNLVYHAQTKHIDIQHYSICNKVTVSQINL